MKIRNCPVLSLLIMIMNIASIHSQDSLSNVIQGDDLLENWIHKVLSWNSRTTGSESHIECINWIVEQFESMGLKSHRDPHVFNRHAAATDDSSFSIFYEDGEKPVTLSSIYPFSGLTNSTGVTGNLVYITGKNYRAAKGKIAVVEVPDKKIPTSLLFNVIEEYPSGSTVLPATIKNPVLSSTVFGPKLDRFRKAGALAVVAVWKNMSSGLAAGQYVPFTLPYFSIPAVWATGKEGRAIVEAAKNDLKASLRLPGTFDTAIAHTVWAVIEGEKKDETILVITHTDGTNPVEENGFLGLLDIANKIICSGKKPQRTVLFAAVAGHLRLPDITSKKKEQATTVWLKEHPEWWDGKKGHRKAVAGLVIEHLGAMEWADAGMEYIPSGKPEIEIVYATTSKMQELVNAQWLKRSNPIRASMVTPRSIRHFGEGEPLFQTRIPAVALLAIPSYLLCEMRDFPPGINLQQVSEIVNHSLLRDQCLGMYNILQEMMKVPADAFGDVKRVGFFGKIVDIAKLVKVVMAKE